ncbi:MAG: dihydroorotase family protein [Candidatus Moranbacteria bacterium]|nr:dihydroorotase family protein [Candidatus Moranbacteria bacterium]
MQKNTICLPETIIDTHCHGRDLKQAYKTTIRQTLSEALEALISISVFMPNTLPAITNLMILQHQLRLLGNARKKLCLKNQQYGHFGLTDRNLVECEAALKFREVLGLKDYPLSADGTTVTTGTIGVFDPRTRLAGLHLVRQHRKIYARHCDNPGIIAREGHTINAEVADVEDMISLASQVPGAKVVACHISCRESAELILKAQKKGLPITIELCPHYLWFDSEGTNWNPDLDPVFYKCFNSLRGGEHREFLVSLLPTDNPWIIIGSDNAPHPTQEKIQGKLGGLPSNQEMVPVICTLAKKYKISNHRVVELLSWNASRFLGIRISKKFNRYRLIDKIDDLAYNNGIVTNPWNGSRLLFPAAIEA